MTVPVWSQVDAGVAVALGAVVGTAAVRKLARPAVFARTLEQLDPVFAARPRAASRVAVAASAYEAVTAAGVVAFRADAGFGFACALLVACAAFLAVLRRSVQRGAPCACFGSVAPRAAGGREIGRALAMTACAAFLVVHRAVDARGAWGAGPVAVLAFVATSLLILLAAQAGGAVRPGREVRAGTAR